MQKDLEGLNLDITVKQKQENVAVRASGADPVENKQARKEQDRGVIIDF